MSEENKLTRYNELFLESDKAKAFDQIAEQFYAGNFGRMTKADIETLMFSIYIEQILSKGDEDFNTYSDYRLAKELGITQSKVRNLKEKKQLQYPRKFSWQNAFARVSGNARYENGKIKIQIPDINLYYEIKNAVEEAGGFIDVSLTSKLLQISPEYFLDLLSAISADSEREQIRKEWRAELRKHSSDQEYLEEVPIRQQMVGLGKDIAVNVVSDVLSNIINLGGLPPSIKTIANSIKAILPSAKGGE